MYRRMPLEARDNAFYLDGERIQIRSGAVHYFRVVPGYWQDRLERLKACGLNCVETWVTSSWFISERLRERTECVAQLWNWEITHKASDAAENLQLYRVVRFFRLRSLSTTMHLMLFSERPPIYASCVTISGGTTEQLYIIAGFLLHHWLVALGVIFVCRKCPPIYASCTTISRGRTEQHVIIGLESWLQSIRISHSLSILTE